MLTHPIAARSVSTQTKRQGRRQAVLRSVREGVEALTNDLRNLDARNSGIVQGLPTSGGDFDVLAEFADGLRCVQADLLADAIETLDALVCRDETELRRRSEERQGWRVTEGE